MKRQTLLLVGAAVLGFYFLSQRRPTQARVRNGTLTVPLPQWDIQGELDRIVNDARNGIITD